MKLLPLPGYKSVDPTALIAIFFPMFAGCMIGDIGYGIIFLLCGIWAKRRNGGNNGLLCDISQILINVSILSILWGFLYGEFYGDLGHRLLHLRPIWVERTQGVIPVMAFAVALGFTHVTLGLIFGAYEGLKSNNKRHIYERVGTIFMILGIIAFVADRAKIIQIDLFVAGARIISVWVGFSGKRRGSYGISRDDRVHWKHIKLHPHSSDRLVVGNTCHGRHKVCRRTRSILFGDSACPFNTPA